MTAPESSEARRHRFARAIRNLSSVDAAAQLLEAYEVLVTSEQEIDLTPVDVQPTALDEIESLREWTYESLLAHAVARAAAPEGMHARDLLVSRKYALIGLLAQAAEDALTLADGRTAKAMARLCQAATVRLIGEAALMMAFEGEETTGDA